MSADEHSSGVRHEPTTLVTLDEAQISRLEAALLKLRKRDRSIYLAACQRRGTFAEIASQHHCSVAKVRRIVARVLLKLHRAVWPDD